LRIYESQRPKRLRLYNKNYKRPDPSYLKSYQQRHKERIREVSQARYLKTKERRKAKMREWKKRNPHKEAEYRHARRARLKNALGRFVKAEIMKMLAHQKNRCAACFKSIEKLYHIDHIMPLSRGGSNFIDNIQLLCPSCNCSKQDKDPVEWAKEKGRLL
jgi:5-methylcytosine-specific restriction endonuclease McrA